ncbi:MAG TPA: biotin-dependent carboxyltransferase family protein [Nocardioidaceae bacterium]|nr:biotin-dependent carboxyltransferase family protein [Nocardioidaceae bacterium]
MIRSLRILDAGPLSTLQDRGRPGLAHLGVPRAGALDPVSADLANRLVGNADDEAVLETTLGGVSFETSSALTFAVTGALCDVLVDGRASPWGQPIAVKAGARIVVGPAHEGVRSYLAVSGGFDVEPVLGSRSTDTLAFVGPSVVRTGDELPVGPPNEVSREASAIPRPRVDVVLRYDPGPRDDWFAAGPDGSYEVGPESNRVGLRLRGRPLERVRTDELPSEGIVLGAIQVPADGQPLVFLNDHPTTGGYPVVGVVDPEDLAQCAQLRPGSTVTFRRR